jgi:glycosyltransferase involved in cell wall biosynthesis
MRLALFTDTFAPQVNGVSMTLQRLVKHLEKRQVEHRVFVPVCSPNDVYSDQFFRATSLPLWFLNPEYRLAMPNLIAIRNQLQQFQPDLIHIATPFSMGLSGLHYGKKYNVPHVASFHTYFDRYLEYYHMKFASGLLWRYFRWFHQTCLATFVPSVETMTQLQNRGIQNVDLWKRGVDCELYNPAKRNTEAIRSRYNIKAPQIFLYVGRLAPEKDLDILQQIMANLPLAYKDQVHWLVVGDGPHLHDMQNQSPANVTYTGYQSGETLAEIYASSDLFVFPSSTETFGNVVLEAFASGVPVVGARAGGVQEIIEDSVTGHLCIPRDSEDFIKKIIQLMDQPSTMQAYAAQARQYAMDQSWDSIFDKLLASYEQVIYEKAQQTASSGIQTA